MSGFVAIEMNKMKSIMKLIKNIALTFFLISAISLSGSAQSVAELAAGSEDLSTLEAAIEAAGLTETLNGNGPFTVFAPTNAAFEALPDGVLESLLKPENKDQLKAVLTYHVVGGKVMSNDLKNGTMSETVQGENVEFVVGPKVKVNNATVVNADIAADNGVVHIIDTVILPPSLR